MAFGFSCQRKAQKAVVVNVDKEHNFADLRLIGGDKGIVYYNDMSAVIVGDTLLVKYNEDRIVVEER